MPFAVKGGAVPGVFENLGQGELARQHVAALRSPHGALHPVVHVGALWLASRHQHGAGGTANGVRVSLREADTALGQ